MVKWLTILLAVLGLSLGLWTVITEGEQIEEVPPSRPPSVNPFVDGIASTGIVEPSARVTHVGIPEPGLVTDVYVQVNDLVAVGQPLFRLDDRVLKSELLKANAAREVAIAKVRWYEAAPRAEDIPPLRAAVAQAEADLADAADQLDRAQRAFDDNAANVNEPVRWQYRVKTLEAVLDLARANLSRELAGSWSPELDMARTEVARADADIQSLNVRIDRMTIRAPIAGTILRRDIEPGEYSAGTEEGALSLGDLSQLHVRAMVNEEDLSLLRLGARAVARVRGGLPKDIDLTMLWIEPLAAPKRQITGRATELIDTRVVEVLFNAANVRAGGGIAAAVTSDSSLITLYPGQLVDVFIETTEQTQ